MARARSRRPRATARGSAPVIPDLVSVTRALARPEIIGTGLVVLAAAAIPYLLPLTGIVGVAPVHAAVCTVTLADQLTYTGTDAAEIVCVAGTGTYDIRTAGGDDTVKVSDVINRRELLANTLFREFRRGGQRVLTATALAAAGAIASRGRPKPSSCHSMRLRNRPAPWSLW